MDHYSGSLESSLAFSIESVLNRKLRVLVHLLLYSVSRQKSILFLAVGNLVNCFIEDLMTKFEHFNKIELDEVVGRHLCRLVHIHFTIVFDCSLHE